jgi:hypothetical protein
MRPEGGGEAAYRTITGAFKRRRGGATAADISAATALPLSTVRELVPRLADEYSGRLEVCESGEIRYSFPRGFTSRYRGFRAVLSRFFERFGRALRTGASFLFKVWIMGMLVGYFVVFMLIALASLFLSVAAAGSSNSNDRSGRNRGGGVYFASSIFNLIIRLWFYSELTRSWDDRGFRQKPKKARNDGPLYKRIFSFVFGEDDPNKDWTSREKKAIIAYIKAHRGVISLPECMSFTGLPPDKAGEEMLACCREFGGMPEATPEGTVVYRFEDILRGDAVSAAAETAVPVRRLRVFSANPKNTNIWIGLINGVNLLFGAYFLSNALRTGPLVADAVPPGASVYGFVTKLLGQFVSSPWPVIAVGLGLIPLIFSVLFWLIPALRCTVEKRENEQIKRGNLRRLGFSRIWSKPALSENEIDSPVPECRPKNMAAARDRVIKDMGAYSVPDVEIADDGSTRYHFSGLEREKEALEKYRAGIDPGAFAPGGVVFDSDK